jgi:hypothetical protein
MIWHRLLRASGIFVAASRTSRKTIQAGDYPQKIVDYALVPGLLVATLRKPDAVCCIGCDATLVPQTAPFWNGARVISGSKPGKPDVCNTRGRPEFLVWNAGNFGICNIAW